MDILLDIFYYLVVLIVSSAFLHIFTMSSFLSFLALKHLILFLRHKVEVSATFFFEIFILPYIAYRCSVILIEIFEIMITDSNIIYLVLLSAPLIIPIYFTIKLAIHMYKEEFAND